MLATTSIYGPNANPYLLLGASYQQAFGNLWLRVSPNLTLPFQVVDNLFVNQPWFEIGYRVGDKFEFCFSASYTPLRLGLYF